MQKLVWQNANGVELDLTSGNYGITEWEGFSNASLNIQSQQVPFQDGGVFLDALIEQRELSVTLAMQDNNNLELRYQQRRELISALNPKLGEGYLIYTNDFISKRIKCVPQIPLFETHNSDTVGTPKASLSWTACSPYWEDLEETSIFIQNGIQEIVNNGDVETNVKISLNGNGEVTISNNETNKKLALPLEGEIEINTEFGKKSVALTEMEVVENLVAGAFRVAYNPIDDLYVVEVMVGSSYYTYTLKNGVMTQKGGEYLSRIKWFQKDSCFLASASSYLEKSDDNFETTTIILSEQVNDFYYDKILDLYIVVENNGVIKTSPDLQNWTTRTSGTNENLYCVTRDGVKNRIIACGSNGTVLLSSDCISWSKDNYFTSSESIQGYASNTTGTLGVAVTYEGGVYNVDVQGNWSIVGGLENIRLRDILFDVTNQKFLISSYNADNLFETDGFTIEELDTGDYYVDSICYSEETQSVICCGANILIRTNGGFVSIGYPFSFYAFAIYYVEEKDFYVILGNRTIAISKDLKGSRIVYEADEDFYFRQFAYNGNIALVGGQKLLTSSDFENWTDTGLDVSSTSIISIEWAKKLNTWFISDGNGKIWKTADAQIFDTILDETGYGVSYSLAWAESLGILSIVSTRGSCKYTENGVDIINGTVSGGSPHFLSVAYSEERKLFFAGGHDSNVNISTDGKHYICSGQFGDIGSITWSKKLQTFLFLASGYLGSTPDGIHHESFGISTGGVSITEKRDDIILAPYVVARKNQVENKIDSLSSDSDMSFGLTQGANTINIISGDSVFGTITFRQKYIGV